LRIIMYASYKMSTPLMINFLSGTTTNINYNLTGTVTGTVYTVSLKLGTVPVSLSGDTSKTGAAGTITGQITTGTLNSTDGPYVLTVSAGSKTASTKIYYIVNLGWSSTFTNIVGDFIYSDSLSIGTNLYASDVIVGGNSLLAYSSRPDRPTSVALSLPSGAVTWTSNGPTATSYRISVYSSATSTVTRSSTLVTTVTSTGSGQVITFTKQDQLYYAVTVVAINSFGSSKVSTISSSVQYVVPPLAPTSVALSLPSGAVSWTSGGGTATSYNISVYSSSTSTVTSSSTLVTTVTSTGSGQVITFTKQDQQYYAVTVVAINSAGSSPASVISSSVKYMLPPLAPTSVALSLPSGVVTWTSNGNAATAYSITVYSSSTSTVTTSSTLVTSVPSSASGQAIAFTKQDQQYYAVTVVAINSGGNSPISTISSSVKYTQPPLAPTGVALSLPSGTVTWTSGGGGAATSYSISVYSSSTSTVTTSSTLVTTVTSTGSGQAITFTKQDQLYYAVTVVAINSGGNSPVSAMSSSVRYILPTLAPTNVVLSLSTGAVTWTSNGGTATSYSISVYSSSTSTVTTSSTLVTTVTSTGSGQIIAFTKQDQQYYAVTVVAINSAGSSTASAISSAVQYILPPLAPTNVVLSLSGDGGTVTWTSGGGGIPTSYAIDVYSNSTSTVTTSSTHVGSASITASGQAITFTKQDQLYYAVTVTPVNAGGYVNSAISSSVQYILPPLAPTSVALSLAGNGGTVTWTSGGGGTATSYSISVYSNSTSSVTTSSTLVTTVTSTGSGQAIAFTKQDQLYYAVTVVATNGGGNSPASTISSSVHFILTAPLAPTNVVMAFLYSTGNNFYVTWTPNGDIATSYTIKITTYGAGTPAAGTTTYNILPSDTTTIGSSIRIQSSLTRVTYRYYSASVIATNAAGSSPEVSSALIQG